MDWTSVLTIFASMKKAAEDLLTSRTESERAAREVAGSTITDEAIKKQDATGINNVLSKSKRMRNDTKTS